VTQAVKSAGVPQAGGGPAGSAVREDAVIVGSYDAESVRCRRGVADAGPGGTSHLRDFPDRDMPEIPGKIASAVLSWTGKSFSRPAIHTPRRRDLATMGRALESGSVTRKKHR